MGCVKREMILKVACVIVWREVMNAASVCRVVVAVVAVLC